MQTFDIIGKHIYEFKNKGGDSVPDVFILLISFFEMHPELYKTEGLFRINGSSDLITELQCHITQGNYYFLTTLSEEPHVVANFLKKILRNMGEPLCTYALYT